MKTKSVLKEEKEIQSARQWNYDGIKFKVKKVGLPAVGGLNLKKIKDGRSMNEDAV